jgi:hypothetical protein
MIDPVYIGYSSCDQLTKTQQAPSSTPPAGGGGGRGFVMVVVRRGIVSEGTMPNIAPLIIYKTSDLAYNKPMNIDKLKK